MNVTPDEMLTFTLAREIRDIDTVYVGAGVPLCLAAAMLAKATHAPDAKIFSFAGIEIRRPIMISLRMIEAAGFSYGLFHDMAEVMNRVEGHGVLEPLAPAQIDVDGNANTICIGSYDQPAVRLPGFAGADAVGSMPATNVYYTSRHSRRVLVDHVDFVMVPGFGARKRYGAAPSGPRRLITDLAVFDADQDGHWQPASVHPGVAWKKVRENTAFPLPPKAPPITSVPAPELVQLLRRRIDPFGVRRLEFTAARSRRALLDEIMAAERAWLQKPVRPC